MVENKWVSFCISTFKRPAFLKSQLASLLMQSFDRFDIVISDNDPEASGRAVAAEFNDDRIRYFHNEDNLGMIRSFNKSIERASTDYVVMVTDDDPVENNFLEEMYTLFLQYPGFSLYGGFVRNTNNQSPEVISAGDFIYQILDPHKTPWLLWSSCVMKRDTLLFNNCIPDYGSPHLADHALIAMAGSKHGGVIVNKKYSHLVSHDSNFSKFNFDYYVKGCEGFYQTLIAFNKDQPNAVRNLKAAKQHIYAWFITNVFNLKKYYTVNKYDPVILGQIDKFVNDIFVFPWMKAVRQRYQAKQLAFNVKKVLHLLK